MWCSTCQQDVPALGSPDHGGELRCGKCGESLAATPAARVLAADTGVTMERPADAAAPENVSLEKLLRSAPLEDEWALEAELRGVQRLIGSLKSRSTIVAEPVAVHVPHGAPSGWHAAAGQDRLGADAPNSATNAPRNATVGVPSSAAAGPYSAAGEPRGHVAAWTILSLGLAVFACGAVLIGWSLVAGRVDLWPVGMPLALVGQAGLVIGLILQFDGLWHTSRATAAALSELDDRLKSAGQITPHLRNEELRMQNSEQAARVLFPR